MSLYAFFAPHLWGANLPRQGATKGGSRGFPTLARYTYGSAKSNIGLLVVADLQSVKRPRQSTTKGVDFYGRYD